MSTPDPARPSRLKPVHAPTKQATSPQAGQAKTAQSADPRVKPLPPIKCGKDLRGRVIVLPPELIKGMLHQGGKMLLGGGSKAKKTYALVDLAVSIAAGVPWWGLSTSKGDVLYLNFEVQEEFFESRLQQVCQAKRIEIPDAIHYQNLRGHCGAGHETLLTRIAEQIQGRKFIAIIVDPTYKLMTGGESDPEAVGQLMNSIEKLGVNASAAVIFGAHFSKGNASGKEAIDRVSGSGVWARDPDAILMMTPHEEDDAFTIETFLRNCPPIPPFVMRLAFPLFVPDQNLNPEDLKQPPSERQKEKKGYADAAELLPVIPVDDAVSKATLITAAKGLNFSVRGADAALERLKKEKKVHEFPDPKSKGPNPKRFLSQTHPKFIKKDDLG